MLLLNSPFVFLHVHIQIQANKPNYFPPSSPVMEEAKPSCFCQLLCHLTQLHETISHHTYSYSYSHSYRYTYSHSYNCSCLLLWPNLSQDTISHLKSPNYHLCRSCISHFPDLTLSVNNMSPHENTGGQPAVSTIFPVSSDPTAISTLGASSLTLVKATFRLKTDRSLTSSRA